ncbi:9572_t:CDS:10 [Funneliformis mosseae]|uniref:mRNA guanylyltransferase n=1 Tax=Funneliformis mosseae TaxID=27381 RepID=A0A9N9B7Z2_FUNMO|nr:9572_t:CDS:10 [Funneliformis mosseae]
MSQFRKRKLDDEIKKQKSIKVEANSDASMYKSPSMTQGFEINDSNLSAASVDKGDVFNNDEHKQRKQADVELIKDIIPNDNKNKRVFGYNSERQFAPAPGIPGQHVEPHRLRELRSRVRELVGVSNFPGAQPISFSSEHIQELQNEDYYVCEKTDGTRVLAYITCDSPGKPAVFLILQIDRKNYYRLIPNLLFPIPEDPTFSNFHNETIIDCELVNDTENDGNVNILLVFDLLVMDKKNFMNKPLNKRLGYLRDYIMTPYEKMLRKRSDLAQLQPFYVIKKEMEFSYGLEKVLKQIIPSLKHKSDGLIFTSLTSGYSTGTFEKMLKWKPPNENSIDFKLHFEFPSHNENAKPRFCLYKWIQKDDHRYFDDMYVTDEEWEQFWKHDFQQYEGRIVEVVYNPSMNPPWRFIRFRDDKPHANHHTLLSNTSKIRDAWKKREALKNQQSRHHINESRDRR